MPDLDDYTQNNPGSPFRDPAEGEEDYITPAVMREFAQSIQDAILATPNQAANVQIMEYTYNNNPPPAASGQIRFDDVVASGVTLISIASDDQTGVDYSRYLTVIKDGDFIDVQDKDDAAKWARFAVSGSSVPVGATHEIPVAWVTSAGTLSPGQRAAVTTIHLIDLSNPTPEGSE